MTEVVYRCYLAVVALLALHGVHRLALLWAVRRRAPDPVAPALHDRPFVTVQLPVYNERDVVARLVDAVAAMRWPADRMEIQLLDDSTDDTGPAAARAVAGALQRGIATEVVRRSGRAGFKAGALAHGLELARGDYIAIFDADFVPGPDFLEQTLPHVVAGAGMVQVRWTHINRNENLLTRAQAALLDGHFVVEQPARQAIGAWFNFNGTAGVWQRDAIVRAGGWQHDTLTEDLDLSYRALLDGERFVYLCDNAVPAELPGGLPAFLAQQRRWARGSLQTARKLAWRVVVAPVSLRVRFEALVHLTGNLGWPLCVAVGALLPFVVLTRGSASVGDVWLDLPLVGLSLLSNAAYYRAGGARWRDLPLALALGIGMGPSQASAAFEGLCLGRGEFVRTPKNGGGPGSYGVARSLPPVEVLLAALNLTVAAWAGASGHVAATPFLLIFGGGYGWVAVETLRRPSPTRSLARAVVPLAPPPEREAAMAGN
ncbi:MAG: glycosyltransferase [Myxococcales bacterium]|nr:glycosyltransferase [Myxococcales bacterium]